MRCSTVYFVMFSTHASDVLRYILLKHWSEILQVRLEEEARQRQDLAAQLQSERAAREAQA